MKSETFAVSLRIPADAHLALEAFAKQKSITLSDALLRAVYEFLSNQGTTSADTLSRLRAETELFDIVLDYAKTIKTTQFSEDATYHLFEVIQSEHHELYKRAIGSNAEHAYRVNPQIAKRFAIAIEATQVLNDKDKPVMTYLPRNANKLIQSYTKLRKK
jgi:hypothetical protein